MNHRDRVVSSANDLEGFLLFKGLFEVGKEHVLSHSINEATVNEAGRDLRIKSIDSQCEMFKLFEGCVKADSL